MKFIGIIPARFNSTRFPGKPLAIVKGETMIRRVYQQALKCNELHEVIVATDDQRIFDHVNEFGKAVMTSSNHPTGSDRCLEAFTLINENNTYPGNSVIINIQGDEPFIQPQQISLLIQAFDSPGTQIATLVKAIESNEELFNENVVKAVINNQGNAMYFSRQPIPFLRSMPPDQWVSNARYYKHIGLYAYTADVLKQLSSLPGGHYEIAESLEQLRWLESGFSIRVMQTALQSHAVDTPQDLIKINAIS